MLPLVALEEHFVSKANFATKSAHRYYENGDRQQLERLTSFGRARLEEMDIGNVRMQVISYAPLPLSASEAVIANNELAEAVKSNPSRFSAFAALSLSNVKAAADELARCVEEHHFVGALIPNHLHGEFFDAEKFWPLFAKAEELHVPIYIHPARPTEKFMNEQYRGNFSEKAASQLAGFGFGWHSQVGLHILRLFASGLFDRYPRLQLVIGHMGEMLPYQLDRILRFADSWGSYQRGLREVWDNNIWITTSGMFSLAPMACLLRTTKVERIMFSLDYPFAPAHLGLAFMEELEQSDLVNDDEFAAIAYKNAESLLGISAL